MCSSRTHEPRHRGHVGLHWPARPVGEVPDEIAVSVVTAAELEPGVLRATDQPTRAQRLATLGRVRADYPLLPIDDPTASCFARIADEQLRDGRSLRSHDTWIAAVAPRHNAAVVTQDEDFTAFAAIPSSGSDSRSTLH